MSLQVFERDPDGIDYVLFDFSDWLEGDTIASPYASNVDIIADSGLVIGDGVLTNVNSRVIPNIEYTSSTVKIYHGNGTAGQSYNIVCRIATADGLVKEKAVTIRIKNSTDQ